MAAKPKLAPFEEYELDAIPRGDTCPGVNRIIVEKLGTRFGRDGSFRLLDAPCGSGTFIASVAELFQHAELVGCDVSDGDLKHGTFLRKDLSTIDSTDLNGPFDAVTCISGVMEFENTGNLLRTFSEVLAPGGVLYVSNDNISTIKDRLLYLIGGRYSQYKFDPLSDSPTWKVTPLTVLLRTLKNSGFNISGISYTRPSPADMLWAPLALPIFAIQKLTQREHRFRPFRSMLSRHYVVECYPATSPGTEK